MALATADRLGAFCAGCHQPRFVRTLPARFSHRLHMDRGRMEQQVGFHPACEDCHALAAAAPAQRSFATHEACARCHEQNASPHMTDCASCHDPAGVPAPVGRRFIRADLHFSHAAHEFDRVGRAIPCVGCHDHAADARTPEAIVAPAMTRCTQCHEDRRQSPQAARMSQCGLCHLLTTEGLAPRSHQLGTLAPDDHTLVFRRDHADSARAAGARCAQCHQGLSGSVRDSCQECHAVMRPRDHGVTWREQDHGLEAAAARARCVACHLADFCESCHSVPPRSHLPRAEWAIGHGQVARLELRACFACHTFEGRGSAPGCAACHARGIR
ncbi:MAG TPA: hypothetical protein VKN99_05745 [Polyangia bacterium]|nr:hypothetical protein [Polyangia bacterium]